VSVESTDNVLAMQQTYLYFETIIDTAFHMEQNKFVSELNTNKKSSSL